MRRAVTRHTISNRWTISSTGSARRPRNCWKNTKGRGPDRSIRSTRNTPSEPGGSFRRLCRIRQVIERRDDVFGERVGERGAFVRIAHEADAAGRQFGESFGRVEYAHAGAKTRFWENGNGKTREHSGGDRAGIGAGI